MADTVERFMLVPVEVDAFVFDQFAFNTPSWTAPKADPNTATNHSTLAPLDPPSYRRLKLQADSLRHDVFEQTNVRSVDTDWPFFAPRWSTEYSMDNDYDGDWFNRLGVILHWSLPKMYRTGLAATPSAQQDHEKRKAQQGFASQNPNGSSSGATPTFRTVPDRWIIIRHVQYLPDEPSDGKYDKVFVIESNRVRTIDQIPRHDDVLAMATPYLEPSLPLDRLGEHYLGRMYPLDIWTGDLKNDPLGKDYIPLTVNGTSNPYFADYQPHNIGVFSFFDDFQPQPGEPGFNPDPATWGQPVVLPFLGATITYTVLGYHSVKSRDPLIIDPSVLPVQTHNERLKTCFTAMKDTTSGLDDADRQWLDSSDGPQMRTLCHGNIIAVQQPQSAQLPFPGWNVQQLFRESQPIAVGTNEIDALLGWMRGNTVPPGAKAAADPSPPLDFSAAEQLLLKLQPLVQSIDDDADSQLEAADLLATNNFSRTSGGTTWQLKRAADLNPADSSESQVSTAADVGALRTINLYQDLINGYNRELAQLKVKLFEEYWTYVADRELGTDNEKKARRTTATTTVAIIVQRIQKLGAVGQAGSLIDQAQQQINHQVATSAIKCESGVRQPYYNQRDPTVLFVGVPSGRDTNLAGQPLPIRLDGQDTQREDNAKSPYLQPWFDYLTNVSQQLNGMIAPDLGTPISNVIQETPYLYDGKPGIVPPYGFQNNSFFPGSQPWYPLFMDWTVEYYHIPKEAWNFTPQGPERKLQFGIPITYDITPAQDDFRVISGRSPLLPQVASTLQTTMKQLFAQMNPDELKAEFNGDPNDALKSLNQLLYLSTTLTGFTDQLITRRHGLHVQPNKVHADGTLGPLPEALQIGTEIGLTAPTMVLMESGQHWSPYASVVDIPASTELSPFKPCTHGQFRFTKMMIVDKFGQVVTPVDIVNPANPSPIFPCLGQTYTLEVFDDGTANAVVHRTDKMSEFVQLPLSINQPARVNADFVTFGDQGWRPLDEWESPVSGWIVINFPDFSLQVFDQDGHFIREFQIMSATPTPYPFPPVDLKPDADPLLKALIQKFADPAYLHGLFTTLSEAVESVKHPPTAYAESIVSILGKPLAIVKMGFSMELADPPLVNLCTISPDPAVVELSVLDYQFPMQIGDADNVFDGLMGYFELESPSKTTTIPAFDLCSFFSYFTSNPSDGDPSKPIPGPLQMYPYYVAPIDDPKQYAAAHNQNRHVVAAFIDPFVSVHAYTQLLPLQTLSLPQWVISSGITRVAAFFRVGPLLVPGDVPGFDPNKKVQKNYMLDDQNAPATTGKVAVPSIPMSDWVWLQPFLNDVTGGDTEYNFVDLDTLPPKPTWQPTPYSTVEGFLQMKKPFTSRNEDVPDTNDG